MAHQVPRGIEGLRRKGRERGRCGWYRHELRCCDGDTTKPEAKTTPRQQNGADPHPHKEPHAAISLGAACLARSVPPSAAALRARGPARPRTE
eukprot:365333-Chlamydomonas_euryale.AAC.26